ncbi:MAG: cation diffusion facilitator family transporter [Sulfurospirillaceae bacterium]|nr:cation diffusion facilitator family transporter [Sulfurospirillaceae bacterium]
MSEHHHHEVSGKNLFITIVLNIIITIAQIVGGIVSGSLALLSDALHNFSDVIALLLSYTANKISKKPRTETKTFGYKRAEILASLFNATVLIGIGLYLVVEAISKFINPVEIKSSWVIFLAILSIVLNFVSVILIKEDSHHNLNIRSAYLHLLSDVATSVAVLIGGLVMMFWHIYWIDSAITLLIAFYLIYMSYDIVKQSVEILMQHSPRDLDTNALKNKLKKNPQIKDIHHVHLWQLDDKNVFIEAHVSLNENLNISESNDIMRELTKIAKNDFGISHTTWQVEYENCNDN